ncbi:MAG TPA: hypothetical protein VGH10_05650 [Actinomycetota bacterium]
MQDQPERLRKGLFGYRKKSVRRVLSDRDAVLRVTQERTGELEGSLRDREAELADAKAGVTALEEKLSAAHAEIDDRDAKLATAGADLATTRSELSNLGAELRDARTQIADREDLIRGLRTEIAAKEEGARLLRHDVARLEDELRALREAPPSRGDTVVDYLMGEVGPIIAAAEDAARRITERAQRTADLQVEETYRLWRNMQGELARFGLWRDQIESLLTSSKAHFEDAKERLAQTPDRVQAALEPITDAIEVVNRDLALLSETQIPPVVVELGEAEETHGQDVVRLEEPRHDAGARSA